MGLNINNRIDLVKLYLEKAQHTLEEADIAIGANKWSMAANRIYYALFHATNALFVSYEIHVSTHRGAKQLLGKHFVLTGKLTQDEGRFYAQMESLRDKADYDITFTATQEQISEFRPKADLFIKKITKIIENNK